MDKLDAILKSAKALKAPKSARPSPVSRRDWEEAVGSRIARRAQPLRVDRGVLYVRVANAAWANELSLLSSDILGQLVERGLEITSLRFSVGPIAPRDSVGRKQNVVKGAPSDAPLPDAIKERVVTVEDDELKDALAAAAAKSLSIAGD